MPFHLSLIYSVDSSPPMFFWKKNSPNIMFLPPCFFFWKKKNRPNFLFLPTCFFKKNSSAAPNILFLPPCSFFWIFFLIQISCFFSLKSKKQLIFDLISCFLPPVFFFFKKKNQPKIMFLPPC